MVGSFALGAVAVESLHAQAKLPAYVIAEAGIADPDGYAKEFLPPVLKTIQEGICLRKTVSFEGAPPALRVVVVQWESLDKAQAWWNSQATKDCGIVVVAATTLMDRFVFWVNMTSPTSGPARKWHSILAVMRLPSGVTARNFQTPLSDSIWSVAIRTFSSAGSLPSPLHGAFCVKLPSSQEFLSPSAVLSARAWLVMAKMPIITARMRNQDG